MCNKIGFTSLVELISFFLAFTEGYVSLFPYFSFTFMMLLFHVMLTVSFSPCAENFNTSEPTGLYFHFHSDLGKIGNNIETTTCAVKGTYNLNESSLLKKV